MIADDFADIARRLGEIEKPRATVARTPIFFDTVTEEWFVWTEEEWMAATPENDPKMPALTVDTVVRVCFPKPSSCAFPNCNPADKIEGRCCGRTEA